MAAKKTSKKATRDGLSDLSGYAEPIASQSISGVIEEERARLMKAEAVLHCVEIAMDERDGTSTHTPHYQAAISVARDLVAQAINRLDSVQVRPMLEKMFEARQGIRESTPKYLH